MKRFAAALFSLALCLPASADVPSGFTQQQLTSSLKEPVGLAFAPDGRLFIIEKNTGRIQILKNGAILPTPFATVAPLYTGSLESGLLGLCLDPEFASNGHVYVFCTVSKTEQRVVRYKALGDSGTNATVILAGLPSNGLVHNSGGIAFGPDGKLYVSVGDNGDGASGVSQDLRLRKGKILRYNRDGSIPTDNPFGADNPVFCYGLRNTFRIAFQPGTGRLLGTENGPNWNDEINILKPGRNYGWPMITGDSTDPQLTNPLIVFPSTVAVAGLAFYSSDVMPFRGDLFYVAFKTNKIVRVTLAGETVASSADFATKIEVPVDLAMGPDGAIYVCTYAGKLYRFRRTGTQNLAPYASFTATPAAGPAPLSVTLSGAASNDLDGSVVSYSWSFGDGGTAAGATVTRIFQTPGNRVVTLTVTDNAGAAGTTSQTLKVSDGGNAPPEAHIESVSKREGKTPLKVLFKGHGHDENSIVRHSWDFGDGTPVLAIQNPGVDKNSSPEHVFMNPGTYHVVLTVTDGGGLTATHQATITAKHPHPTLARILNQVENFGSDVQTNLRLLADLIRETAGKIRFW